MICVWSRAHFRQHVDNQTGSNWEFFIRPKGRATGVDNTYSLTGTGQGSAFYSLLY